MEKLAKHINLLSNGEYILPFCNCLLIKDEINCLVDSSPPEKEMEHLRSIRLDMIINSHGHCDHCSRNYSFPETKILLHPTEHERVASGEAYLRAYGFDFFPNDTIKANYLSRASYHERPADGELIDGQIVDLGNVQLQVMHLPGHSIGHCGFVFSQEGFVFTADIHLDTKPFYAMLDSSVDDFIETIDKLRRLHPDMIVAGHGKAVMTKNIDKKLARFQDVFFQRDEQILKLVRAGKHEIKDIATDGPVFSGRFPHPWGIYYLHECVMVMKHLERLERLGKVFCSDNKYYLR
jgi:glyoxylase-like metal-dependent hydrolase (beta-lactamase superfamily II)